jgi:hypothetical protein
MTEQDGVPFGGITPHTFQNLTDSQKLDVIIDTLNRTCSECRARIEALEKRKNMDSWVCYCAGMIGGGLAFIGSKMFKGDA